MAAATLESAVLAPDFNEGVPLVEFLESELPALEYDTSYDMIVEQSEHEQDVVPHHVSVWRALNDRALDRFEGHLSSMGGGGYRFQRRYNALKSKMAVGRRLCHIVTVNTARCSRFKPKLGLPEVSIRAEGSCVVGVVESAEFLPVLSAEELVGAFCGRDHRPKGEVHCFKRLLLRLLSYMRFNDTRFGLITTWETTWFIVADASHTKVGISEPVSRSSRPLLHLWFVLQLAANGEEPLTVMQQGGACHSFFKSMETAESIGEQFKETLRSDFGWGVAMHCDVSQKLQVWSSQALYGIMRDKLCRSETLEHHDVIRGYFQGRDVAIKMTDLSHDWDSMVEGFAREVQAYMILQPLQGSVVPELLAHGIANGNMLAFCIFSYAGEHVGMQGWDVADALDKIYRLGVVHTNFRAWDVLGGGDSGRPVKIVGFSSCYLFDPAAPSPKALKLESAAKVAVIPEDSE